MTRKLKSWQAYGLGIGILAVAGIIGVIAWMISPLIIYAMFVFFGISLGYGIWKNKHIFKAVDKPQLEQKSNQMCSDGSEEQNH